MFVTLEFMFRVDIKCLEPNHDISKYYWTNICCAFGWSNDSWYWKYVRFLIIMGRILNEPADAVNNIECFFFGNESYMMSSGYFIADKTLESRWVTDGRAALWGRRCPKRHWLPCDNYSDGAGSSTDRYSGFPVSISGT